LYFDIFYVDLETAELYRGFLRRFLSNFSWICLWLPTDSSRMIFWTRKTWAHEVMHHFFFLCSRLSNNSNNVFDYSPSNHKKIIKILIFIMSYYNIPYLKHQSLSKVILRVPHRCFCEASNDKNHSWQLKKEERTLSYAGVVRETKFTWNSILQFIKCWTFSFCTKTNYKNRISHLWLLQAVGVLVVFYWTRDEMFFFCVVEISPPATNLTNFY
jgi:hypothetical protein